MSMMTTVRAHCDDCGDLSTPIAFITVRICRDIPLTHYTLTCPRCAMPIARQCELTMAELLIRSGAESLVWSFPAELAEAHAGPPISHDDVLDFALALGATPTADR